MPTDVCPICYQSWGYIIHFYTHFFRFLIHYGVKELICEWGSYSPHQFWALAMYQQPIEGRIMSKQVVFTYVSQCGWKLRQYLPIQASKNDKRQTKVQTCYIHQWTMVYWHVLIFPLFQSLYYISTFLCTCYKWGWEESEGGTFAVEQTLSVTCTLTKYINNNANQWASARHCFDRRAA